MAFDLQKTRELFMERQEGLEEVVTACRAALRREDDESSGLVLDLVDRLEQMHQMNVELFNILIVKASSKRDIN